MLLKEYQYYTDHHDELYEKYADRYIVIKGEEVLGVFDSASEAYMKTAVDHKPGTFLIQLVTRDLEIQTFASRVIAA